MREYGVCMQGADGVYRTLGDVLMDLGEGEEPRAPLAICARCGAEFARAWGRPACYCERCAPARGRG
jgi:hypothetical protein